MTTILKSSIYPSAQAQINLSGYPEKISPIPTLTPVSPAAQIQAQTVRPAQTPHTSNAPSQVSVFIQTLSVTVILIVNQEKMRNCQYAKINF